MLESDEGVRKAMDGIKLSLLTIIIDPPKGRYGFIYAAFDGGLSDYRVGYEYDAVTRGIDKPTFVVSGKYEVFTAIQRGELSDRTAILTRKLHLTGSMLKALRHMHAMESITKALVRVPCKV